MSSSTLRGYPVPELAISAHGLLLLGLAMYVSVARNVTKVIDGHKGEKTWLGKTVRAHGNAAEYVPYLAVIYLYYAVQPFKRTTIVDYCIVVSTIGRVLNAFGLLNAGPGATLKDISLLRPAGATLTYVSGTILAISVGYNALYSK